MKIVFNGLTEKRSKGCPVCGKRITDNHFLTMKSYILPSGMTKTFRAGKPEEVSEGDAEFLLSYKYKDAQGNIKQVFDVWN